MTTSQPNHLELAKQGDIQAIAFLMNRSLKPKGITAKTALKDDCLQVMVEATEVPDQQTLTSFVHKGVVSLGVPSIRKMRIYGRKIGDKFPVWSQELDLQKTAVPLPDVEVERQPDLLNTSQVINPGKNKVQTLPETNPREPLSVKEEVLLECKGENGILVLTDTKVTIKRKGGFLSPHKKGEKHIPYGDIIDFQYNRSNLISAGFIYFQLKGLSKEINFLEANSLESAVTFVNERIKEFDKAREILVEKVNPQKYDNVFEGRSGTLVLTETGVIIKRVGGLLSGHTAGEKNIPYKSITAVQFKKAGITVGFIQFTLQGGIESKGGAFEAVKDENTVTFANEEKTKEFEQAKNIIEQRISIASGATGSVSNSSNDLEQLEKLASLRDKGILSEEEFQAKKKKILDL